jgi:GGDEF domain-containing protein
MGQEASEDDLLKWADTAMYQAKAAGNDAVRFFRPSV